MFKKTFNILRKFPGKLVRMILFLPTLFNFYEVENFAPRLRLGKRGKNTIIQPTASLHFPENIFLGNNSHINHQCCIWAGRKSKIVIGNNGLMGPGVLIFAEEHGMKLGKPMTEQPLESEGKDIIIGNDVWIGKGASILSGVKIGDGVIVGAHTVVSKDVPPYAVIVGNPYVIKRYRYSPEIIDKLLKIKWWEWSDEIIKERILDFREINQFIELYGKD